MCAQIHSHPTLNPPPLPSQKTHQHANTQTHTTKQASFEGNKAGARDGGGVFALDTNTKFRGCDFKGNAARKGEDLYNHGGLAEIYCARVGRTFNKPKVCVRYVCGLVWFVCVWCWFVWGWFVSVCSSTPTTNPLTLYPLPPPHPLHLFLPKTPKTPNNTQQVGGHVIQDCFTCPAGRYGDFESAGSPICEEQCQIQAGSIGCYDCPFENACQGKRVCKPGCVDCVWYIYIGVGGEQCQITTTIPPPLQPPRKQPHTLTHIPIPNPKTKTIKKKTPTHTYTD